MSSGYSALRVDLSPLWFGAHFEVTEIWTGRRTRRRRPFCVTWWLIDIYVSFWISLVYLFGKESILAVAM